MEKIVDWLIFVKLLPPGSGIGYAFRTRIQEANCLRIRRTAQMAYRYQKLKLTSGHFGLDLPRIVGVWGHVVETVWCAYPRLRPELGKDTIHTWAPQVDIVTIH